MRPVVASVAPESWNDQNGDRRWRTVDIEVDLGSVERMGDRDEREMLFGDVIERHLLRSRFS